MIRVVLPGALRQYSAGVGEVSLDLPGGVALGEVLDAVEAQVPGLRRRIRDEQGRLRRYVNVYVDGADARQDGAEQATVPDGAEVLILPSVAGG